MVENKDLLYQKTLADVMLDAGESITLAGKTYELKRLKMYTRWKISSCIVEMQLAENDMVNIVESMFTDIPLLCKMITYAILRDRDKIENPELFNATYQDLLDVDNPQEYLDAFTTVIRMMDIEWFFFIQETAKSINILPSKAGLRERNQSQKEQEYTLHPATLEK